MFKAEDDDEATACLDAAVAFCADPNAAPELKRLAATLTRWRNEIRTSTAASAHNGRTEAANAKIKDIKRSAWGFGRFTNYRLRILLAVGREPSHTHTRHKNQNPTSPFGRVEPCKEATIVKDRLNLAQGYLAAEGWDVKARGRDLLLCHRDSRRGDDEKDYVYVWVPADVGHNFGSQERQYLRRFEEAKEVHPTAELVLLVPGLEGLSTDFRSGARRWYGVKVLVPAQFFDTDFRWERDRRTASATSELRKRGTDTARTRIAQPFHVLQPSDTNGDDRRTDLLDMLHKALRDPLSEPTIHIIVGHAGMGKSVLFDSLYSQLYDDFLDDKRALHLSARPFALLPEYMSDATAPTIGSLLDAYLRTEFVGQMDRDMFNWKLVHGLGIWLLDGLDEILERDARFFDHLEDLMTMPGGGRSPSIVICVRDSLFATHKGLKDFCEEYRSDVIVYRLDGWGEITKGAFARQQLRSEDAARAFIACLIDRPALDDLASTPYYCSLLIEEFATDGLRLGDSETDILERGLERIIGRERDKDLLQGVSDQGIRDLMESCATTTLFEGGVLIEDVREMAEVVIPEGIDAEEITSLTTQMGQLAVFTQGHDGRLRFAQEPLEHYLAANHMAHSLQSMPERVGRQSLGRHDLSNNVIRLVARCIDSSKYDIVWKLLVGQMHVDSIAGRNALRLAVTLSPDTDRLGHLELAGLNLSGMRFEGHDLRNVGFDGANLTNADFRGADLTDSNFDNCIIKGTRFDADIEMLGSITFGEMHRFHSAHIGEVFIDDTKQLSETIGGSLQKTIPTQPACPAARQLRHLFGKFVEVTGEGRRKDIPQRALHRGAQYVSDTDRDNILSEAIRAGYLIGGSIRDKVSRAQDDSYSEIIEFRTDLKVSPGIRALLDDTCQKADCRHVR